MSTFERGEKRREDGVQEWLEKGRLWKERRGGGMMVGREGEGKEVMKREER